jgi:hypothetical protein
VHQRGDDAHPERPIATGTGVLVGRDAEMGTLWAAVQRAGAGVGGSVVVVGEAGIGKRGWFPKPATFARPLGMKVLVGRVVPGGGAMAFRALPLDPSVDPFAWLHARP